MLRLLRSTALFVILTYCTIKTQFVIVCLFQMLFKRVATIEEFFDIVYAAHSENGHVGQAQTFKAVCYVVYANYVHYTGFFIYRRNGLTSTAAPFI